MAKVTVRLPDKFISQLNRMVGSVDGAIPSALEAGGAYVKGVMQSNLDAVVGKNVKYKSRSTGKLQKALGVSPVKPDSDGNYDVKVGFAEGRGGVSNAMLANVLEYGKHGQPAKPFLAPTKSKTKAPCIAIMEETIKRELGIP